MADGTVVIRVLADVSKATQNVAAGAVKMGAMMSKSIGGAMAAAVNATAVASVAGVATALVVGGRAAVEFEDAMAMVKKTMADVEDPLVFEKIEKDLQNLATQIPITSSALAQLASVAGQLGVAADDVAVFAEVTGKLSVATNMTGNQAATSLARFLNVTNESTDTVGKFGAVLVELGNNVAATESEIMLLAQNFGATGTVAGLSAEDILAFSAATRASGVQAAAGATALGKMFMNISNAVKEGNTEKLAVLSRLIGTDFKRAFEEDGAQAVQRFLSGLSQLAQQGESVTPILQELGLNNVRTSRAVLALANNHRGLADAISMARQEAIEQNALNQEMETRMDTVSQQMQLLKSTWNTFAQTLGKAFLPIFSKIITALTEFVSGLIGIARWLQESGEQVKIWVERIAKLSGIGAIIMRIIALFKNLKDGTGFTAKIMQKLGVDVASLSKVFKRFLGVVGLVWAAFQKLRGIGRVQQRFTQFNTTVDNLTTTIGELAKSGQSFAEGFNEETLRGIAEGLPKHLKEGVMQGIDDGSLTEAGVEASQAMADGLNEGLVKNMRETLEVGKMFDGETLSASVAELIQDLRASGISEESEIFQLTKKLNVELEKNGGKHNEITKALQNQLSVHVAIIEAERNHLSLAERLERALIDSFTFQFFQEGFMDGTLGDLDAMVAFAKSLGDKMPPAIKAILIEMGLLNNEVEEVVDIFADLEAAAENMQKMVDAIFKPAELDFARQFAEMDLTEAQEELNDLKQEEIDLLAEKMELNEELLDLQEQEIMTNEEIKEQQDLLNEALVLEDRLRKGQFLTANQFLRKEKLKKDLRRVELAAAQGSLEFADEEAAAIQENIDLIDDKAISQADADKLRAEALEISENAQIRRQEDIERIESRRVDINERLKELPRETAEAHFAILGAQKDIIDSYINIQMAVRELTSVTEEEAIKQAKALGIPVDMVRGLIDGVQSSVGNINQFIPKQFNTAVTPQTTWERFNTDWDEKLNFKPMAIGGSLKPSSNYLVGERGPELLKMFPHGGGYATALGEGGGMTQNNNVSLNITGLPTDPIAARKIAQNIQRELNKLANDGRSGVVR